MVIEIVDNSLPKVSQFPLTNYTTTNQQTLYLSTIHRGVVLHVLLHGHTDISRGQGALGVAELVQSGQRVEASVLLELRDLVTCQKRRE